MRLYKQEFGEDFALGFELGHFPFLLDKSWHNDVCPSFMFKSKKGSDSSNLDQHKSQQNDQYLVLWTDYFNETPDEDQRENTGSSRYTVVTATNLGSLCEPEIYHDEHSFTLFESDDPKALTQFLEKHSLSTLSTLEVT